MQAATDEPLRRCALPLRKPARTPSRARLAVLPASVLLAGCGGPDESAIRAEFLRRAPRAEIVELAPGEGDGAHVYYHIRYRLPPGPAVHEAVWGYRRGADGRWTRFWPGGRNGSPMRADTAALP